MTPLEWLLVVVAAVVVVTVVAAVFELGPRTLLELGVELVD